MSTSFSSSLGSTTHSLRGLGPHAQLALDLAGGTVIEGAVSLKELGVEVLSCKELGVEVLSYEELGVEVLSDKELGVEVLSDKELGVEVL